MNFSILIVTLMSMTLVLSGCGKSKRRDRLSSPNSQQRAENAPINSTITADGNTDQGDQNNQVQQEVYEDELLGGPEGRRRTQAPGGEVDRADEEEEEEVVQTSGLYPVEILA